MHAYAIKNQYLTPSTRAAMKKNIPWKSVITTTLIAGTLDLSAASIQAWFTAEVSPRQLLLYIASGMWGKDAYTQGDTMLFFGLLFHFIIVFACVGCFFWVYPKWTFLQRSILLNAFLIGLVAWLVTTQIIIRLSSIPSQAFNWPNALLAIAILIVCIGLPTAFAAKNSS